MEVITAKRFLVRSLFDGERTCQLMLVDLTGPVLKVSPFDTETPATVFIDSRVVLFACMAGEIPDLEHRLELLAKGKYREASLEAFLAYEGKTPSDNVVAVAY